jgi:hypothetical protein
VTSILDRKATGNDDNADSGTLDSATRLSPTVHSASLHSASLDADASEHDTLRAERAEVVPDEGPAGSGGLSGVALGLVLMASFMVVLDFSIVNVALPSIRLALGFGGDSVQWVVTAYAITFGGLLVLGGRPLTGGG